MEGSCSTGQSPQRAAVPVEEEEVINERYTLYIANGVCLYSGDRVRQQVATPKLQN
jgi:hypothetical protein